MFDVLIVGGGPAALTAAIYSRRAGKSVLIVERMVPGGQIALTNTVENYPGIKKTDGMTLATMMFELSLFLAMFWNFLLREKLRKFEPMKEHLRAKLSYYV